MIPNKHIQMSIFYLIFSLHMKQMDKHFLSKFFFALFICIVSPLVSCYLFKRKIKLELNSEVGVPQMRMESS